MPFINVKLTPEGLNKQIKEELIEEFTQILVNKLNKNAETTIVIIDEVSDDNWGIAGQTVSERKNQSRFDSKKI